jgi:hypothetical protein
VTRLSFAEARKLNIDERIIRVAEQHAAQAERSEAVRERLEVEPPKPKRAKAADGMNKTERAFAEMLDQSLRYEQISGWRREPVKFRLAGRTWYTPDFVVCPAWSPNTPRYIFEVKGFMRDDASVKLKVAAELYPCFRWFLVRREGRNGWDVREITSRGIGTYPIVVPWIQ